jgi:hypothetical protein
LKLGRTLRRRWGFPDDPACRIFEQVAGAAATWFAIDVVGATDDPKSGQQDVELVDLAPLYEGD